MTPPPTSHNPRTGKLVAAGLAVLAVYQLALGIFMAVAPGPFYELVGPFGPQNDHYTRDNATFALALGVVALIAVRRRSWRLPVIVLAVVQFVLHTVNHLIDIDEAEPSYVGPADFVSLLIGTLLLIGLLVAARRADPPTPANPPARSGERGPGEAAPS